ncbi:hypothetical protein R3P38DRAFT_3078369 [Favolaschia claudopus]|uniref:F-box domain-containing protein n=1 Tax=Favolaschia claudopus TaxID=2862362 RepID=A0AAV9ZWY3_9AGAR
MSQQTIAPDPEQSPFFQHFNTNYVPTDAEIDDIRTHISPYDSELGRLDFVIQKLSAQRERLQKYVEPHRALVSYPRRLPQDILEEIFSCSLPTDRCAVMSAKEAPLLLGRICSAWRSFAFKMPRLWTSLHLPVSFVCASITRRAAVMEWLGRSAELPLTVSLVMQSSNSAYNTGLVTSLLPLSYRWRAFYASNLMPQHCLLLSDVHAPLLEQLRISIAEPLDATHAPTFLSSNIFQTMKNGNIHFSASLVARLIPTTPFTWNHITSLALMQSGGAGVDITPGLAYRLLQGCKNLRVLSCRLIWRAATQSPIPDEPLILPSLLCLRIQRESPLSWIPISALLGKLTMPALRVLSVPDSQIGVYADYLEHTAVTSPQLTSLNIGVSHTKTPAIILETIQLFPGLKKLSLTLTQNGMTVNGGRILLILTPGADSRPLPPLEELRLDCPGGFNVKAWVEFLEKNLEYGTALRRFGLRVEAPATRAIDRDIERFSNSGIALEIEYVRQTVVVESDAPTAWDAVPALPWVHSM